MPEMRFRVRWPDETETLCYSPSLIIRDYFIPGESYALTEFVDRSRAALNIASERVFQKFGFYCTSAIAQLKEIEDIASRQPQAADSRVTVVRFSD